MIPEQKLEPKQGLAKDWAEYLQAMWADYRDGRVTCREMLKKCVAHWPKRAADMKLEDNAQDGTPTEGPLEYEPPSQIELADGPKEDFLATVKGWSH